MTLETVLIFCVIGCILVLLLKQYQKTQGVMLSIAMCIIVFLTVIPEIRQIFDTAQSIYARGSLDVSYFGILCKAVGIAWLTQIGTDICKDCGENAISTAVELCGRVMLVLLALPLFLTLAETVLEMMQ